VIVAPTAQAVEQAARALLDGRLVVFPTETVYGLGADAANRDAVAAIYALKGRPPDHPLIVHVRDLEQAARWARLDERAARLARRFWPGPMTLILPRAAAAPAWACGGQDSIGLRIPSHPVARALLERFTALGGSGVAAPSANRFGRVSPTCAEHVRDDLGADAPMILDGGPCDVGVESTIVDLTRACAAVLRPGRIDRRRLEDALEQPLAEAGGAGQDDAPRASGTLAAHYSPSTPVELVAARTLQSRLSSPEWQGRRVAVWSRVRPRHGTGGGAGGGARGGAVLVRWAALPASPERCEELLYRTLRELDAAGAERIIVEAPPEQPEWEAVHDRLNRAAAGGQRAAR
jgi:L-threonylcarbamoyladenylate synthase